MNRHSLQYHSGGVASINTLRQFHQPGCRNRGILRIRTHNTRICHPVAGLQVAHVGTNGRYHAGGFLTVCERQIRLVEAGSEVNIDEVHPGGIDLDKCLIGRGRGVWGVLVGENLRAAMLVYANCLHGVFVSRLTENCNKPSGRG